jgi:amino acid transporter
MPARRPEPKSGPTGRPHICRQNGESCLIALVHVPSTAIHGTGVTTKNMTARPLRRILGLGFGIALVFGTMIGVGILRLPGTVAAALVALIAVLFLVYYVSAFLAVFVLRHREPTLPRPYKAFGYPFSTAVVLVGSVAFLIAAVVEDPRSGIIAAVFLASCAPLYSLMARGRRLRAAAASV